MPCNAMQCHAVSAESRHKGIRLLFRPATFPPRSPVHPERPCIPWLMPLQCTGRYAKPNPRSQSGIGPGQPALIVFPCLLSRRNAKCAASVCPADVALGICMVFDLQNIAGNIINAAHALVVEERLERHNLAALLEVKEQADQLVIELWREGLVVDEHDVGAFEDVVDGRFLEEVSPDKIDLARRQPPKPAALGKLLLLRLGEIARVVHHLAAPALATDFKRRLQHDVADTRTKIDKDLVRSHARLLLEDLGNEHVVQLSVHIVGAVGVLLQLFDVGGHGAVVDLGQDEFNQLARQAVLRVEVFPECAVVSQR
ncbi:hypothetical protein BN1708_001350 [Verticillium longisporum]|uniref:Uncharacterized protein n=1 Tax=Verticillium longisporum TaxID=100787 RepID=A0A0G4MNQ7_VERLO|nr:hypothetical protein BN1708_001350 [Verticillium longisporum]